MGKQFVYITFFLFFVLIINWTSNIKTVYYFLILVLIGVLVVRVDEIEELVK
jgi:hypothetical protein